VRDRIATIDALERIIERFRFDEVAAHMEQKRWYWHRGSNRQIPTPSILELCVRELCDECIRDALPWLETGGFRVEVGSVVAVKFRGKGRFTSLGGPRRKIPGPEWTETEPVMSREQPNA
jgi:hypothetical protein